MAAGAGFSDAHCRALKCHIHSSYVHVSGITLPPRPFKLKCRQNNLGGRFFLPCVVKIKNKSQSIAPKKFHFPRLCHTGNHAEEEKNSRARSRHARHNTVLRRRFSIARHCSQSIIASRLCSAVRATTGAEKPQTRSNRGAQRRCRRRSPGQTKHTAQRQRRRRARRRTAIFW